MIAHDRAEGGKLGPPQIRFLIAESVIPAGIHPPEGKAGRTCRYSSVDGVGKTSKTGKLIPSELAGVVLRAGGSRSGIQHMVFSPVFRKEQTIGLRILHRVSVMHLIASSSVKKESLIRCDFPEIHHGAVHSGIHPVLPLCLQEFHRPGVGKINL